MGLVRRIGRLLPALILLLGVLPPWGSAVLQAQQFFSTARVYPSDDVTLDVAGSTTRTQLERAKAFLADRQWDDAVEILRQIMEHPDGKMFELAEGRYISLRDYCQLRIAALPEPALRLYRDRVDSQARRLYEQGLRQRDQQRLLQTVQNYFASSFGDDALYVLGELALSEGDYAAARNYWAMLIELPQEPIPADVFQRVRQSPELSEDEARLLERWYRPFDTDGTPYVRNEQPISDEAVRGLVQLWNRHGVLPKRLGYPGTDRSLMDVRARLVLTSILEGAQQARGELQGFAQMYPQAEGKLGGRSGRYVDLLTDLLESSTTWPPISQRQSWHTFGGNEQRNFVGDERLDLGELVWRRPLERTLPPSGIGSARVAEPKDGLLSYHPIVVGNLVLVAHQEKLLAFDLQTGEPAWNAPEGVIFKTDYAGTRPRGNAQLGAPRFTLSAYGNLLFARIGSPVTSSIAESHYGPTSAVLRWFDLDQQARLLKEVPPGDEPRDVKWAFDGVPVCDGTCLYVAMRRSETGPKTQAHVACYDVQTGKLRWRRFVAAAETLGRTQMDEVTHNLLTLANGVLYFNTNLGAVAALSAADGEVRWISCYPRARSGELNRSAKHLHRDLNPCLYHQGRLFVAPADTEQIFAFDAQTGDLVGATADGQPEDAVHLLGVLGNTLIASGDKLWAFDIDDGLKVVALWPPFPLPSGFGRGVLMGDEVIWPTREELYHFRLEHQLSGDRKVYWWHNTKIDNLLEHSATGGNLVVTKDRLLIASSGMLYAFRRYPTKEGH